MQRRSALWHSTFQNLIGPEPSLSSENWGLIRYRADLDAALPDNRTMTDVQWSLANEHIMDLVMADKELLRAFRQTMLKPGR